MFKTRFDEKTGEESTVSLNCDICDAASPGCITWSKDGEEDTRIEWRSRPGGDGLFVHYSVDICPACFETRLIPRLRSQGAVVRPEVTPWGG